MKYTVTVRCVEYLTLEVEADSFDEAKAIADETDGGDYTGDLYPDWDIDSIVDETGTRVEY